MRAEAGVTWGEFDRETQAFGLATTGGVVLLHRDRRASPWAAASAGWRVATGWPATT